MMIHHPVTGFAMGDPDVAPLVRKPTPAEARHFFDTLILSASGWRGVFATSDDDMGEALSPAGTYVVLRMAQAYADFLYGTGNFSGGTHPAPAVALGIDTRPTGPAIADAMARVFLARGIKVRYAFVCAAPEIMAWTRRSGALPPDSPDRIDGFCYISASHNPPGHNGVKFGLADGGVLPGTSARTMIAALREGSCTAADIEAMAVLGAAAPAREVSALFAACTLEKRKAISDYTLFAREVAGSSPDLARQEEELDRLSAAIQERGSGIIAELNGSARSMSIDGDYLAGLGVSLIQLNARPRSFVHRIVPEGESLEPCRVALGKAHADNQDYVLGYVPDCDGDRGNIVYWDDDAGTARALEAQDTFALAVLAELASMESRAMRSSLPVPKTAVACNDATSLRVDAIAGALGTRVFRSETGEANVVGLARSLREEGYEVRVLGEGSNGGVITHPASVRDPLNTVSAILKLLYLRDVVTKEKTIPGPYRLWLERTGRGQDYHEEFGLCDILSSLPGFASTSVFEDRAALRIQSRDHAALKNAYQDIFQREWPEMARKLEPRYGRLSWKAMASIGTTEHELSGPFGESGSGGIRIVLLDGNTVPAGFLWMRGSGTEPVFRIMADAREDDGTTESVLLEWHASMVRRADSI